MSAKVATVDKARKDQGNCGRCGDPIKAGDPYRHASPGFRGRKLVRCVKPECQFRQSELTTSMMADVYASQEAAHDELDALAEAAEFVSIEDVETILNDSAEAGREVAQQYNDAAEAMGAAGDEHTERAEIIESWADELDALDYEGLPTRGAETDEDWEQTVQDWRDGLIEEARSLVDGLEL